MHKRKVRAILGLGVIIVIICGVAFFFVRGKDTAPVEEPIQQESLFINENTVTDPSLVEVEEEFKWLDDTNISVDPIIVLEDIDLKSEPRETASQVTKLSKDMQGKRVAVSTDLDGKELGWCRVIVGDKAGYLNIMDFDYILPVDNIVVEDAEVPEELQAELEGRDITEVVPEKTSIVEVEEATPEPTEAPKVEEPVVEEPVVEEPAPTTAPQSGGNDAPAGLTPEAQALYEQMIAAGGRTPEQIESMTVHQEGNLSMGHTGNVWQ